jgi:TonB family protein
VNPWHVLEIAPTRELRDIKRAYAAALKKTHPEDDPEGFQALRAAYERALGLAQQLLQPATVPPAELVEENAGAAPEDLVEVTNESTLEQATDLSEPVPPPASEPAREVPAADPGLIDSPNPHTAARALCDELLAMGEVQRAKAFTVAMRRPGWEQLDFQAALEEQLLWLLDQEFDRHGPLVGIIAQHYEWDRKRERVGRQHPLVERVAGRLEAKRWLAHVSTNGTKVEREALKLLLSPPDERAFRRFGRFTARLDIMRRLMDLLQSAQRAVLYFEVNQASATWWHRHLMSWPATVDHFIASTVLGFIFGCVAVFGIRVNLDIEESSRVAQLLPIVVIPLMIALFLGAEWLYRWWQRGMAQGRIRPFDEIRNQWSRDPTRRWTLLGVAGASLALNIGSAFNPYLAWATLAGAALIAFWYGLRTGFWIMVFMALPLAVLFSYGVDAIFAFVPQLNAVFPAVPNIAFPYLLATLLFVPVARVWSRIMARCFEGPPKEPLKAAVYLTAVLLVFGLILKGALTERREPPRIVQQQHRHSPTDQDAYRPLSELWDDQERLEQHLDVVDTRFHAVNRPPKGAKIQLWYRIAGSGNVEEVRLVESSFGNADFDVAMIDALKAFRFKRNDHYQTSAFILNYGDLGGSSRTGLRQDNALLSGPTPKVDPSAVVKRAKEFSLVPRPLEEIRKQKPDSKKVAQLYRRFYPKTDADPKASLTIAFTVEGDGTVTDSTVKSSTFGNAPFEKAVAAEIGRMRFPKNSKYEPSTFTWTFEGVNPDMGRPPRTVESMEEQLKTQDDRIFEVFVKYYPPDSSPVPKGSGIGLEFIIERDGSVSEAKVTESTFDNKEFHAAMLKAVKSVRFPPAPQNATTRFTLSYGSVRNQKKSEEPEAENGRPHPSP